MQKVYLHLHNSADKDKKKEIKTTPVPVKDPKRAGQVREADKKLFEKLNKIGTAMLIGFMLMYACYHQDITAVFAGLGLDAQPAHTPPTHQDQGLGLTLRPIPDGTTPVQQTLPEQRNTTKRSLDRTVQPTTIQVVPPDTRCNFVICERSSGGGAGSPLSGVMDLVVNNWNAPANTAILDVEKLGLEWKNELDFIEKLKQQNGDRPLTIVTLELQEFRESSGKELYTLLPENKAKIKLILRGVDAASQTLLFEETIEKDVVETQWANYSSKIDSSQFLTPIYPYSLAMKQALVQTSSEIIHLLYKYFP